MPILSDTTNGHDSDLAPSTVASLKRYSRLGQTAAQCVALALLYAALGWLGIKLATPPGYATLVWPASGLAIAALLLGGRQLWPGVYLGSLLVNLAIGDPFAASANLAVVIVNAAVIAAGSTAQAAIAAGLIRHRFGAPITLRNPADVAAFVAIIGPMSSLIAASVGVTILWLNGIMPPETILHNWLVWWCGDVLGILVILPIALFSQWKGPVLFWRGNAVTPLSGLMAIGLLLLMGATLWAWRTTSENNYQRNLASFQQLTTESNDSLRLRIQSYQQGIDSGVALMVVSDEISANDWREFVAAIDIRKLTGLNGIGYIQSLRGGDEAAFLTQARASGWAGSQIHPASDRSEKFVITYIEPLEPNVQAVGLDISFEENRRLAAIEARDSGESVITKPITLVQDANKTAGFLLFRPVYAKGMPLDTRLQRRTAFRGWVYAPLIASQLVDKLTANQGGIFTIDIYDKNVGMQDRGIHIESQPGHDPAYLVENTIPILNREWTVVWKSTPQFEAQVNTSEPLLVLLGGIGLTLLFGTMLLMYARRSAYVQEQVEIKTRKLNEAAEALNQSESLFADLAGLSPAGIMRTDPFGFCIYVNDSWLQISGLESFAALGPGWMTAIHADDRESFYSNWTMAAEQGIEHRATFRFAQSDRAQRWVDMISKPELDDKGNVLGFIVVAMDVTMQKEMEQALEQSRLRAEHAAEVKSRFLADMSHEIRTPMNGVLGYTQLVLKGDLTSEQRHRVQLIADSGKAMMRLLNDILDLSKVDAGLMQIAAEPVNLRHMVGSCVTLMQSLASEKGLNLDCVIEPAVPDLIESDGLRLRQILLNLIGNALKFTSKGHVALRICIDASVENQLILEVEDTGIGIAPERQKEIFDAFVQVKDDTTRDIGGTGLGLAISGKLARLMGGELSLESTLGVGSVFRLSLPVVALASCENPTERPSNVTDKRRGPRVPRLGHILLVEDNDINQQLMSDMVHQLGLTVDIAENGQVALACVRQAAESGPAYDLVLMDVRMPVMNGLDATRAIRAEGHDAEHLPIVALTANGFADDVAACLNAGMQAHLTKPIDVVELERLIALWARRSSDHVAPRAATRQARPIKPSLQKRYVERKRQAIEKFAEFVRLGTFSELETEELCDLLHKLAGTAGLFGEPEFGEQARTFETSLREWVKEGQIGQINAALETLNLAA